MTRSLVDVLDSVKSRLFSIPITVYDRDPDPTPTTHHWVQLSIDPGNLYDRSLGGIGDGVTIYFRPMCVGTSQASTLDAVEMVRNALVGWDPFPDEASNSLVEEEETTPPLLPSTGVAGQFRYTLTPTYRLRIDR